PAREHAPRRGGATLMQSRPGRRALLMALRLIVSGGLLAFLVWQADPATIWERWRMASLPLLVLTFLIQLGCLVLSAFKWSVLLRARGHNPPFGWLLGL